MSSDIKLTIGGVKKELSLMKQDGRKLWGVSELTRTLRHTSGSAEEATLPPDTELRWVMNDWSGGMGQFFLKDPTKYFYGYGLDTAREGEMALRNTISNDTLAGDGGIAFTIFDGSLYALTPYNLYIMSDNAWTLVEVFSSGTASDVCVFNGTMFVALGAGVAYKYSNDGTNFVSSTLTDNKTDFFAVGLSSDGTGEILWKAKKPDEVTSNADGENGGTEWSTISYIGNDNYTINGLFTHNDRVLIGKDNGLFHLDYMKISHNILDVPYAVGQVAKNFAQHVTYKGALYFLYNLGVGEITAYNSFDLISPRDLYPHIVPFDHTITALATDGEYLYLCCYIADIDGGGDHHSTIIRGKERVVGGVKRWEWHPWALLASVTSGSLHKVQTATVFEKQLWALQYNKTYTIVESSANQTANCVFVTSWYDAGYPTWTKLMQAVELDIAGSGVIDIDVYYEIDDAGSGAGDWVSVGTWSATGYAAGLEKKFKNVSFSKIRFKFDFAASSGDWCLKSATVHMQLRPERIKLFNFTVAVGDTRQRSSKTIRDFLDGGRTSTSNVTLTDRFGTDWTVVILPGYPEEVEIKDETGRQSSLAIRIVAMEVDAS